MPKYKSDLNPDRLVHYGRPTAPRKGNPNGHRRTADQQARDYIKWRKGKLQEHTPKATAQLKEQPKCQTTIGGRKVSQRGVTNRGRKDERKYTFLIIVGGERCNEPAISSVRNKETGKNEHRCGKHQSVEWVDTGVVKPRPDQKDD